jgi:hypothetical protein
MVTLYVLTDAMRNSTIFPGLSGYGKRTEEGIKKKVCRKA